MLNEFLASRGVEVVEASDGTETLRHVTRSRLQKVDLDGLVLDLQMPRLGGIEALKRIRGYHPTLSIIVVTGSIEPALHRQAQALGARAVLRKPVILSQLWEILIGDDGALRSHEKMLVDAPTAEPGPASAISTRVLVVDDDADLREVVVEFLESQGYQTSTAPDGLSAVRALAEERVDVILLDINMPGLCGADALPTIRALAPRTPVIMMTANIDGAIAKRTLAHGAFDYLVKPPNWKHLAHSLKMALERKALDAELDGGVPAAEIRGGA
jgi:CheY-like chemotaxis protein